MQHEQSAQIQEQGTRATIDSFDAVFNRHHADALATLLTEVTVFEDTSPAPDGRRIEGKAAVDLDGDVEKAFELDRLAGNKVFERGAVEEFHGPEGLIAVSSDFVDGAGG